MAEYTAEQFRKFKKKYFDNYSEFLEKLKNFDIKNENEGLVIINDLYKTYTSEREMSR